jgi:deazaflavin-dependent oxidoreductase (nitroreductase family)
MAIRLRQLLFRKSLKAASAVHRTLYRASGGRIGGRIWGLSILLLTTTGRKSGRARTTPLCFLRDGDALVVVASNGGMDWFPDWWLNLLEQPRADVLVGRERRAVVARRAAPAEHARLWAEITAIAPGYLRYRARTAREIPLVLLETASSASVAS